MPLFGIRIKVIFALLSAKLELREEGEEVREEDVGVVNILLVSVMPCFS